MTSIHAFRLSEYMLAYIEEHAKLYSEWSECKSEFLVGKGGVFEEDMVLEELKYQEGRGISLQETEQTYSTSHGRKQKVMGVLVPPHAKTELDDDDHDKKKQTWRWKYDESKSKMLDKLYTSLYKKWKRTWEFNHIVTPKEIVSAYSGRTTTFYNSYQEKGKNTGVLVVKEPKVRKAYESADESRYDIDAFIQSRLNKDRTIKCKVLLEEYGGLNKKLFQNRYYLIKKKL